mgnify:CR=1 FL=1
MHQNRKNTENNEKCSNLHQIMHIFGILAFICASISLLYFYMQYLHTCVQVFKIVAYMYASFCTHFIFTCKYLHTCVQVFQIVAHMYASFCIHFQLKQLQKYLHTCMQLLAKVAYMYATICKFLNSQYIPVINVFSVNPPPILAAAWNLPPATFHTSASFVFCPNFQALSLKKKKKKNSKICKYSRKSTEIKKKSCINVCNFYE